ncbi:TBC1D23 [Cordylochernes scorpioides]|uniref:TBC1D23 n=1 Tax=Cordylochernes scorpioides TaxID=51811 RepID=A0ABY6LU09_9ARAC|nr:TBC1D23 [Cordylochernes scorpioides]
MKDESKEIILGHIKSAPCALELLDVEDFCLLAQYYCQRTPQDFLKKNKDLIFEGDKNQDSVLYQALCLPVDVDELIQESKESQLHFFVVDCRPAEQYNNGHLTTAYHLDATLMLQEPAQFSTAVQALWAAQKQAQAAQSAAWGEHICFMGSGKDDEDQYMNMAIANFLQRGQEYLSVAYGGFPALHSLGSNLLSDHYPRTCMLCADGKTEEKSLFERFTSVMKTVSSEMKDYINNVPSERCSPQVRTLGTPSGQSWILKISRGIDLGVVMRPSTVQPHCWDESFGDVARSWSKTPRSP